MRRKPSQKGSALVESALITLVFLVMILGIVDFGRMVWIYTQVAHGAREASRYAMVRGSATGNAATVAQIQAVVTNSAVLDTANTHTAVTFNPDQSSGSTVSVAVTYTFNFLGPYIPIGSVPLMSTSQMIIY